MDREVPIAALTSSEVIEPHKYLKENGIGFYHPLFSSVDEKILKDLQEEGIETNVWTVDYKEIFDKCMKIGVEGIITNYPELDFEK
nr:glycerophosphodiester phosphodiesterase family protein [Peptoniphilus raoultii]